MSETPEYWLEECREFLREKGWSFREAGLELARAIQRGQRYSHSAVSRYLSGEIVTMDMTLAFAAIRGVLPPIGIARSPREAEWFRLGQELANYNPHHFEHELTHLRALVAAERKAWELRKRPR